MTLAEISRMEGVVARRFRDADDFEIRSVVLAAQAEVTPDRVLPGEVLLRENLIDDGHGRSSVDIAFVDRAAGDDRHLHGLEKGGAYP